MINFPRYSVQWNRLHKNLTYYDCVAFFLKGQLRASWLPTCLQDLHIRDPLCFFSMLSFDFFNFWPGLIRLHLPTDLISLGGCIITSPGMGQPTNASISSPWLVILLGSNMSMSCPNAKNLSWRICNPLSDPSAWWINSSIMLRTSDVNFAFEVPTIPFGRSFNKLPSPSNTSSLVTNLVYLLKTSYSGIALSDGLCKTRIRWQQGIPYNSKNIQEQCPSFVVLLTRTSLTFFLPSFTVEIL
jgi:hypothetical protein